MSWYENNSNNIVKESSLGYGAILSPDGVLYPVQKMGHEEEAQKILKQLGISKRRSDYAETTLLKAGWASLTFAGGFDIKHYKGLTEAQVEKIIKLYQSNPNNLNANIENPLSLDNEFTTVKDPMEFYNLVQASRLTPKDINYKILKQASWAYGHWISPNGQIEEVQGAFGHHKAATQILRDMGEEVENDKNGFTLLDRGWVKTVFRNDALEIDASESIPEAQASAIQKIAETAGQRIQTIIVYKGGSSTRIDKSESGKLKGILLNNNIKTWAETNGRMIKTADGKKVIKTAATDLKEFEKFLKNPDSVEVNAYNQVGNSSSLYDVQRYVMDSYNTKTSISKTKRKITVSILTTHGFLGSVAFNKYWTFSFDEWKSAIEVYKKINEVVQETIEHFIEEEITSTVFWPILKFKLDQVEPERNAATNIPWVNYSRYYNKLEEPDWRKNIYGPRYPDYDEPSYDQEVRRKGVFFD